MTPASTQSFAAAAPWRSRPREVAFALGASALAVTLVALQARRAQSTTAADDALSFCLGVTLPLLAYAAVRQLGAGEALQTVGAARARYGADRRAVAFKQLGPLGVGLTATVLALVALSLCVARGFSDPRLSADVLATLPIALLAAPAYLSVTAAGATVGRRGQGAAALLFVDWLLGSTGLPLALATPRGALRHLLGLGPSYSLAAWASFLLLAAWVLLGWVVLRWRIPR